MTTKALFTVIFICLTIRSVFTQTYNPSDSTILRAIDTSCDINNNLNWNTEPNPGNWTGITWTSGRVTKLVIDSLNLTGNLNVSGLSQLKYLYCSNNQLTSLDASGLTQLVILFCFQNQLTGINVSGLTKITNLDCNHNQLTSVDISGLNNLIYLYVYVNRLTSLDVKGFTGLKNLKCYNNQLTSLDVEGDTALVYLDAANNRIASLNVPGLTNLTTLRCNNNRLTSLDVSGLINLQTFQCYKNQLPDLNVRNLSEMTNFQCYENRLTSLDVSDLNNLTNLLCYDNQLSTLDVSNLINLLSLNCQNNKLPFNALANGLHVNTFFYIPQDTIFNQQYTNNTTLDYSSQAVIDGVSTNFELYKDGTLVQTNTTGLFTVNGAGVYNCKMTNAKFPGLTLITANVSVAPPPPFLSISANALTLKEDENDTAYFDVISNIEWKVISTKPWISIVPESGSDNGTIAVTANDNTSPIERLSTLIISGANVVSLDIKVIQAASETGPTTALKKINDNDDLIYPNPFTDNFKITLLALNLPARIEIYTLEGRQVKSVDAFSLQTIIGLDECKAGIYVVRIISPTQILSKKVVKQ
jgi:Leucine-rich repeat (LRR) protein